MTAVFGSVSQSRPTLPVTPPEVDGRVDDSIIVVSASIEETSDKHAFASISMRGADREVSRHKKKPISFRYGTFPNYGYFYGYVVDAMKDQPHQGEINISYACLGYTYPLRKSQPRVWSNTLASQIIQEIVSPYGLGFSFTGDDFRFERLAQTSQSDWQMVTKVARQLGKMCIPYDGVIRLIDPIVELDTNTSVATFEKSSNILDSSDLELLSFEAQSKEDSGDDEGLIKFSFFTSSNEVTTIDDSEVDEGDKRTETKAYVASQAYADQFEKTKKIVDSLSQAGSARIRGNGAIKPGTVIGISTGTYRNVSKDSMDGRWLVGATKHEINETVFQTELTLIRDEFRQLNDTLYEPFRGQGRADPRITLSNGEWKSSWR
jgi:hypothetical protein